MNEGTLPELPGGWVWTRLGEIGEVVTGTTPSKSRSEFYGKDFPFYKPTDLNDGYYVKKAEDGLSKQGLERARLLPPKSILVTCIGATIGKTGFIRVEGASNQQINAIIPEKYVLPEFIYFISVSPQFQKSIIDNASATTLPILNKSKFEILTLPLPPLPEQRRIVTKLEELFTKLDAGVEALKKTRAQLKRYRQSVLKAACEGKLVTTEAELARSEGRAYEPADVLLVRILKERREKNRGAKYKEPAAPDSSALPALPEGWCWAPIEQIGELISGQHILEKDYNYDYIGLPYLTGPADFGLIHPIVSRWTEKPKTIANKNDVLITVKGAGVGKVNILDIDKAAISRQLMAIRVKNIENHYIFFFILSKFNLFQKLGAGSTIPGIDRDGILNTFVPLPPLAEQRRIVTEVERRLSVADEVARTVEQSLAQAGRLRQSILKKAFEGKLVPQNPEDEPAGVLLEKIRLQKQLEIKKGRSKR